MYQQLLQFLLTPPGFPHQQPCKCLQWGTSDPSVWFTVLELCCFQVAWPSSEADINCRDQSGLAFEEVSQMLLCKPFERCSVPFMFPFHLSLERAKGGSSCDRGLLMLVANSFQINFYIFVTGIWQPLYFLDLGIALARLPVSEKNNFCTLNERKNKGNVLLHHVDCITCCFEFFPLYNTGCWVVAWLFQDRINCPVKLLVIPPYVTTIHLLTTHCMPDT